MSFVENGLYTCEENSSWYLTWLNPDWCGRVLVWNGGPTGCEAVLWGSVYVRYCWLASWDGEPLCGSVLIWYDCCWLCWVWYCIFSDWRVPVGLVTWLPTVKSMTTNIHNNYTQCDWPSTEGHSTYCKTAEYWSFPYLRYCKFIFHLCFQQVERHNTKPSQQFNMP